MSLPASFVLTIKNIKQTLMPHLCLDMGYSYLTASSEYEDNKLSHTIIMILQTDGLFGEPHNSKVLIAQILGIRNFINNNKSPIECIFIKL